MNNPYDQQAVTACLRAGGRLTAAELAKTLHWPRTRVRVALAAAETQGAVRHNPDRTWEKTR